MVINKLSTERKQIEWWKKKNREPRYKHEYTWELVINVTFYVSGEKIVFPESTCVGVPYWPLEKNKS